MRALAVDVGTGTQDILLFDADREIENALRLVLPSPTVIVAERIRVATRQRRPVVLSGRIMGGGPSAWAARDHALAGLPIAATPEAGQTLDDDLAAVAALGVRIVKPEEAAELARAPGAEAVELGDLDLPALEAALAPYGVDLATVDAVAVAVFDHGAAPPGVSDRRFRFARLAERLNAEPAGGPGGPDESASPACGPGGSDERPTTPAGGRTGLGPVAFAYRGAEVPPVFTRLRAAAEVAGAWLAGRRSAGPTIVAMDTGPAAVLGGLEDARARTAMARGRPIVAVNVGNFHALAMRLASDGRIEALMEHHTGELDRPRLARLVARTAEGTISDAEVFGSMGHGALVLPGGAESGSSSSPSRASAEAGDGSPGGGRRAAALEGRGVARDRRRPLLLVTGPCRGLLGERVVRGLGRAVYAVPHGDMMQAGPFGLLRALAHLDPAWREPVERRLGSARP